MIHLWSSTPLKIEDRVVQLRAKLLATTGIPNSYQGITKDKIRMVLDRLDRGTPDMVGVVFALLDDSPSWFSTAPEGSRLCDGASTAHLACHVGIFQRGQTKLDREGRDYWIKPLREIGAIECVTLIDGEFIAGHPIAKHPGGSYKLNHEFVRILKSSDSDFPALLDKWIADDAVRGRLELQAKLVAEARERVDTDHSDLINDCAEHYARRFLSGYKVIYIDDGDGDRITDEDKERLSEAGIRIDLSDAMPDILLWNQKKDSLWVIEAVTSDGEVDTHKKRQLEALATRFKKTAIGFTTAYRSWKDAANRQSKLKNIAPGTSIWISEDPSKQFLVEG